MAWFWQKQDIDSISNSKIRDIEDRLDRLEDRIKSLKGYVYAKRIDMKDFEKEEKTEKQQDLNSPIVPIPFNGYK